MTADYYRFDRAFRSRVTNRNVNEVRGDQPSDLRHHHEAARGRSSGNEASGGLQAAQRNNLKVALTDRERARTAILRTLIAAIDNAEATLAGYPLDAGE